MRMIHTAIAVTLTAAVAAAGVACTAPPAATPTTAPTGVPTTQQPTEAMPATEAATAAAAPTASTDATLTPDEARPIIEERAAAVLTALASKDLAALAGYVDPVGGVRFSPYAFVKDTDLVFMPDQLAALPGSPDVYEWGSFDGSGEPIRLTYDDYDKRFVYSLDFTHAKQVGYNLVIGNGNTLNNAAEYYPGSIIVEHYDPGYDPDYSGLKWQSLRLVFQERDNVWYLVGVIHDQWTI